jgi:uncharacterized protein YdiU (UPF0061 family)
MKLNIADTFTTQLPQDNRLENYRRQVFDACFSFVEPKTFENPQLIHVSKDVLQSLGFTEEDSNAFKDLVAGQNLPQNLKPYAMCYGGHQFGNWAGQLGDGRAINLAQIVHQGLSQTIQLKGAGATPYSRSADGFAVLRSSIREHLCSEAMYYLGVPTTRSLSLSLSGEDVLRDVMYDGNPAYEKGAIVCRVAPSFIRFGNFELFASRNDTKTLQKLADYTINEYFPNIEANQTKDSYLSFFESVFNKTIDMIVEWQRVGFVHGVMNTDNMSIHGITIDYGPYGWLEDYNLGWTPNTTDNQHKRYRFGNQPQVAFWNLIQLANALVPLIKETDALESILDQYHSKYLNKYIAMMSKKLGFQAVAEGDKELVLDLESLLMLAETDMTIFFRLLSNFDKDEKLSEDDTFLSFIKPAFYNFETLKASDKIEWFQWLKRYQLRLKTEDSSNEARQVQMNKTNPKYVLRNYMAHLIIEDADKGDYNLLNEIFELLKNPYSEQSKYKKWFTKRPDWAKEKIGCSMLSCSS